MTLESFGNSIQETIFGDFVLLTDKLQTVHMLKRNYDKVVGVDNKIACLEKAKWFFKQHQVTSVLVS